MKKLIYIFSLSIFTLGLSFSSFSKEKLSMIKASQQLLQLQKDGKSAQGIVDFFAKTTIEDIQAEIKSNDQKLAFWVNVYNGFIQYHLTKRPELYEDRRNFFNKERIKIAGQVLSFSNIEHGIIRKSQSPIGAGYIRRIFRPTWERKLRVDKKDWRVHFALNCGAKSCPPVAIYNPDILDKQFDFMTQEYLSEQTTYDLESETAKVVSLFSWFRGDFGGKRGAKKILKKYKITPTKPKNLEFTTYNWTLKLNNYREIKL